MCESSWDECIDVGYIIGQVKFDESLRFDDILKIDFYEISGSSLNAVNENYSEQISKQREAYKKLAERVEFLRSEEKIETYDVLYQRIIEKLDSLING